MRIINQKQELILTESRNVLSELIDNLTSFGANPDDLKTLRQSIQQMDDLFLLVIVGEFNSGKSAFINALMGEKILKEGVTPTTTQINIVRYGSKQERNALDENLYLISAPIEMLTDISIVDTPGTNAIIRDHEKITTQFIPRSDLVLFVTSADRPFTESERAFLATIKDWGKKVVIVLNKIDIIEKNEDVENITQYIKENINKLLGLTPDIFPVSAKDALAGKMGNPELWQESGFEPLEKYINETLDEKARIKLKFSNPLNVALSLAKSYLTTISSRMGILQEDISLLDNIQNQLGLYKNDMQRDFRFRMADIDNILMEMEKRGENFFNRNLKFVKIFDLMKKDQIQRLFEQQVIMDLPQQVEKKVNELIDWMVDQEFRQWEAILSILSKRRREHDEIISSDPAGSAFKYDRERLIEAVGSEAKQVVNTYDKKRESKLIAESAQEAVAATAALGIGAVGIGTIITTLTTTAAVDVTGVLLAGTLAVLGIIVIPMRRRKANAELAQKINELRTSLSATLHAQFQKEIEHSLKKISNSITPYERFIRAENEKMLAAQEGIDSTRNTIIQLLDEVDSI